MITLRRLGGICWRLWRKGSKILLHVMLPCIVRTHRCGLVLERLGSDYGGWTVPVDLLSEKSVCYCAGVGVDATFEFALVERFHCRAYSFDPTPRAIAYMNQSVYDRQRLRFLPVGVWDEDTSMRFYAPANPNETSHSVYDLQGTARYFEAECRTVRSLMKELGHERIDLLKLDIEGAWRSVLDDLVRRRTPVSILCVELDSPVSLPIVLRVIRALRATGLEFAHRERDNYLFVDRGMLAASAHSQ